MGYLYFTLLFDEEERIISCSKSLSIVIGYKATDIRGKLLSELISNEEEIRKIRKLREGLDGKVLEIELTLLRRDHSPLYTKGNLRKIPYAGKPAYLLQVWDYTDLAKAKKLIKILLSVNKIIKKALTEEEIYQNVCRSIVEDLGLRMAWVGVPDPSTLTVKPIFWYGHEMGYLENIKISLDPHVPEGRGPTAQAIRAGEIIINPDTRTNPHYEAFRKAALERNYLSSAAIPLMVRGNLRAILSIYASEPKLFSEEILFILREIKESLEFALENIEKTRFHHLISTAMENSDLLLLVTDQNGHIKFLNHMVTLITGYLEEELLGQEINLLDSGKNPRSLFEELKKAISEEVETSGLYICRKKDGEVIHLDIKFIPITLSQWEKNCLLLGRDMSLEVGLMESIERLKDFDPLTGCLSFRGLKEKAERLLSLSNFALLVVIDLYQFTYFNDLFGFSFGDELLKAITERLTASLGENIYIARAGADEFIVFCAELQDKSQCSYLLRKIQNLLSNPFYVQGHEINLKHNLGVSFYPYDGNNLEELYRRANAAASFAKKEGPNVLKFYGKDLEIQIKNTLEAEKLIEEALQKDLFQFYFQPYFDINNLSLAGAEALIRIVKPDGEVIPPYKFIDVLEKSPLRRDFELWAVKTIVEKSNKFKIPLGLNIYPETFWDESFWDEVSPHLKTLQHPLYLEITERGFIKEPEKTLQTLLNLKKNFPHLMLALDDFGTGYSNMGYLKTLPIDTLKVDITFIRDLNKGEKEQGLVKTIIDLAHILKAKALAEGVESPDQLQILDIMGCDFVQGFYFSKPLSEEDFSQRYLY